MRADVEQALTVLKEGRPRSAEKALGLLQNTVFSFSMRVCGHREDAEDTSQETLIKTLRHIGKFDSARALGVWLYKVAKNHCLMSRRRSKFAPKRELSLDELMPERKELEKMLAADEKRESPELSLLRAENKQQLQEAIEKLPSQYRLILVLHDMEELSTREIAEVTGLREGTVRVRLHRARVHVRNHLARQAPGRATGKGKPKPLKRRTLGCKALFGELSDYLDGTLDDSLCDELETHLEGCSPCQAFLDSLSETVERCRRHAPGKLSPTRAARMRRDLLEQYKAVLKTARTGARA